MGLAIPMRRLLLVAVAVFFVVLCVLHVAHADSAATGQNPGQALTITDSDVADAPGSSSGASVAPPAKASVFVPTAEWQEVPKSMHIPAVRDNLHAIGRLCVYLGSKASPVVPREFATRCSDKPLAMRPSPYLLLP
jgi:hypothetical protein